MKEEAKGPRFGVVYTVDGKSYVKAVKEASKVSPVVLHLYQDFYKPCAVINKHLTELALKYPKTKFTKSVATKTIPKFPD